MASIDFAFWLTISFDPSLFYTFLALVANRKVESV
jgi:hypothetical protein